MNKTVTLIVVVLVAGLGWIFVQNFTIAGLHQVRVQPRNMPQPASTAESAESFTERLWKLARGSFVMEPTGAQQPSDRRVIRAATFHVQALDSAKLQDPQVCDVLSRISRRFDVLAIQGIQADQDNVLPQWVDLMNRSGDDYDFALGPRLGPVGRQQQFGFLFNRRTVELDLSELYTVNDRDDLFTWDPLVAWFRARGPASNEAFTFTLVNVRIDAERGPQERDLLDDLLTAVRDDGRGEDDVILAGDFQYAPGALGDLDRMATIVCAAPAAATSTSGETAGDNLILQRTATVEFTGRSGVVDFLREFNLTLPEALRVSDHLPVWAEFSTVEGGPPGFVVWRRPIPADSPIALQCADHASAASHGLDQSPHFSRYSR
jgi:hypothetical protein